MSLCIHERKTPVEVKTMSEDIYVKLGERLNQNLLKMPLIDPVLALLRDVFTEEQAELGAEFPTGAHRLKDLAKQLNRDEADLGRLLEEMADEGLIFVEKKGDDQKEYSLSPFVPGIFEFQSMKGEETDKVKRRLKLLREVHEAIEELADDLFKNPELANEQLGRPGLRTLAVEAALPTDTRIATWEQIANIMEQEESFAVGACACRQEAKLHGDPCRIDAPRDACVYFGKVAEFMIDRGFAKRYSRQELLELLKTCEEYGLVHNVNNFLGDNIVMCNCCGCCCNFLVRMKKYRGLKQVAGSNFLAVVDQETCTGCGDCLDRCQMEALELAGETARVIEEYCIGCGNCISACPSESLSLVRCEEAEPPKKPEVIVGLGV
jgi:NAD-dependent dihydropyrimidine dehydrogenase PreA subunit